MKRILLLLIVLSFPLTSSGQKREFARLERERQQQRQQQQRQSQHKNRRNQNQEGRHRESFKHDEKFNEKPRLKANFTDMKNGVDSLFPTQKPRDLVEGAVNALKSALMGFSISVASIFGLPILLYQNSGSASSIILGGIFGSILATVVTITSLSNAAYQIILGILKTPSAVWATLSGQFWDTNRREWIRNYSLQDEDEELTSSKRQSSSVHHLGHYQVLDVDPDATTKEIKKAYFAKAKIIHPDKNPNNQQANEDFLKLHEAYATLSDDALRAQYDKFGRTSNGDVAAIFNVKVFFAVLMDAESVEPFVGELQVSYYISKLMELALLSQSKTSPESLNDIMSFKDDSRRRQVEIAKNLLAFVEDFVTDKVSRAEFIAKCKALAKNISESAFGSDFLGVIGHSLTREADIFLRFSSPFGIPLGLYSSLAKSTQGFWAKWVTMAPKTFSVLYDFGLALNATSTSSPNSKQGSDNQLKIDADALKHLLPKMFDTAWLFIRRDISYTLSGACGRVFRDTSADRSTRRKRVMGLRLLGQAMLDVQGPATCAANTRTEAKAEELNKRLERAYRLALMKAT